MEEPKDGSGKNLIKLRPSYKLEKQEADEQYQLLTLARSQIQKQIEQRKADERQIHRKLRWFSECDEKLYRRKKEIKYLEASIGGKVEPSLPMNLAPRTTGFICLTDQNDGQWDRNRCLRRLIKKDRIEMDYLEQVQEKLFSSTKSTSTRMASCDTQELNHLIGSLEHGIRHGKKNRVDEMKMIREIRNMKEISEAYNAPEPEPDPPSYQYTRERLSKRDIDLNHLTQHKLNLRLEEVEKMERNLAGHKRRVRRLKSELEFVRKNICCLQKELQDVTSKRLEVYEQAYELGEQKKERLLNMLPDRGWMYKKNDGRGSLSRDYVRSIDGFLDFACNGERFVERITTHDGIMLLIRCPCSKCRNSYSRGKNDVRLHLMKYGFMLDYTIWYNHGET